MPEKEIDVLQQKFEKFFLLHYPKVKNFARRLLKSEYEAEDIAQDLFVKLWNNSNLWSDNDDCNDSIEAYLFTATKNLILNAIKRKGREEIYKERVAKESVLTEIVDFDNQLSQIYYHEIQLLVKLTLERMPEKRRMVFKMSRFNGMSNAEIAQQLNISVRTVEHHIYLALSELKKVLITAFFLFFL